jgi:RNA 3'-terminal phosphate cyclase
LAGKPQAASRRVMAQAASFEGVDAPVSGFLADQLLLPLALLTAVGKTSSYRCTELTSHTKTSIELLEPLMQVRSILFSQYSLCVALFVLLTLAGHWS